MHLHQYKAKLSRAFTAPTRCPHCGDLMVAPVSSEFVEGGEIRHHWECNSCGELSSTSNSRRLLLGSHFCTSGIGVRVRCWHA